MNKQNTKATITTLLLVIGGFVVALVAADFVMQRFGPASDQKTLVSQIGYFLIGTALATGGVFAVIKLAFPNTLGKSYDKDFNEAWDGLEGKYKLAAMIGSAWVVFSGLIKLWTGA